MQSDRSPNRAKQPKTEPFSRAAGGERSAASAHQNVSQLRPQEPPGWHMAGWGFGYIPGVEHSFASSHVTFTGTWCCVRDQVSGCLWACSCSFILESLVFLPLPLFSCAHKVFDELLVKLPLFARLRDLSVARSFDLTFFLFYRSFGTCERLQSG